MSQVNHETGAGRVAAICYIYLERDLEVTTSGKGSIFTDEFVWETRAGAPEGNGQTPNYSPDPMPQIQRIDVDWRRRST